jgi:NAD(P)-dependent dehydrogenase (short-subunit alcohol dehydrogenase family)
MLMIVSVLEDSNVTMSGRTALVTGAASGIGRAVTTRYLAAGAAVVAFDVDEPGLSKLDGEQLRTIAGDVRDRSTLERAVDCAREEFGGLDIVAAVAGVTKATPFLSTSVEERDRIFGVNFYGVWNTVSVATPALLERGPGGRILVCGSIESVLGGIGLSAYVASKHALVGMVKSLALELATEGITVNVISPAGVDTELLHQVASPEAVRHVAESTPIPRLCQPEEVAAFFEFLASPEAAYMTGENVVIDGGLKLVNAHTTGAAWTRATRGEERGVPSLAAARNTKEG